MANSLAGATFSISTTVQNSDLADAAAFAVLSYIEVKNVGSVGEMGTEINVLTYDELGTAVAQKAKGIANAGDPEIEVARDESDAGQILMIAAGVPSDVDARAFKILMLNGDIFWNRGLVLGPTRPGGRNEDFDLDVYTLALVQLEIRA